MGVGDQRPEPTAIGQGVAEGVAGLDLVADHLDHCVVPVGGDQQPGEGATGLTGIEVGTRHRGARRLVEALVIQGGQQDVGRLAAQLERHPFDGGRRHLLDPTPGPGRAGEAHHVDIGVGGQRLAHHRPGAADQVEHPGGYADGVDDLGQGEGVEGGDLAGFEDDGAPGAKGGGQLGHDLVERVVPRGDGGHHPDRFAHHQRVADLLLPGEVLDDGRKAAGHGDGQADLDDPGQLAGHADLTRDQARQLVSTFDHAFSDGGHHLGPLGGGLGRPPVEGGAGCGYRPVNVSGGAFGDATHDRLGGCRDHVDHLGSGGVNPGPVDVELAVFVHD